MDRYHSRTTAMKSRAYKQICQHGQEIDTSTNTSSNFDTSHDETYQRLFENKGKRKAQDVLAYANMKYQQWLSTSTSNSYSSEDLVRLHRSTAVVSIGGADGSELIALLRELGSHYGILVEISDAAVARARENGIETVIQADVMDAASQVISQILKLQEQGEITTVLFSCQSVLHELPSRSLTFTEKDFIEAYLIPLIESGLRVMFYAREPCSPNNWLLDTDLIAIRMFGLNNMDLQELTDYIADELNMEGLVNSSSICVDRLTERTILPVTLGQEVLFKLLYWESMTHFKYEMEEQLTSFQPEDWSQQLSQIGMHTDISYVTTQHFTKLYKKEETLLGEAIALNARNGTILPMPECFVKVFSSSK